MPNLPGRIAIGRRAIASVGCVLSAALSQMIFHRTAPWIGATEPKLTLEEYTDYQCPHCAVNTYGTMNRVIEVS